MGVLNDLEEAVWRLLDNNKDALGLVRVLRGLPTKVEDTGLAAVYIEDAELRRTDEKYGRYTVVLTIMLFTSDILIEERRGLALDLGHEVAVLVMKDPELRTGGALGVSMITKVISVSPIAFRDELGGVTMCVKVNIEAVIDKIDIEVSY